MTTRKNVKEHIDPKTGDIIRTSNETLKVWERIDATTGKVKHQVVSVEMQSSTPKARGAKAKCNEMIERITKMVQDFEIIYETGNVLIECLKNYKRNPRAKKIKQKYFIPNRDKIHLQYDAKHGTWFTCSLTRDVLANELKLVNEIMQRIDEFNLNEHWTAVLKQEQWKLNRLKRFYNLAQSPIRPLLDAPRDTRTCWMYKLSSHVFRVILGHSSRNLSRYVTKCENVSRITFKLPKSTFTHMNIDTLGLESHQSHTNGPRITPYRPAI